MTSNKQSILRDESGATLVIAVVMLVVLTLLGMAASFASIYEVKLSGNKRGITAAFYSADSGVQMAMADINNFDLPSNFVDDKYAPSLSPNPTNSKIVIYNIPGQKGAPRGLGISAMNLNFEYFLIESTGQDQIDSNLVKSTCTVDQKLVRLLPTLQGGN